MIRALLALLALTACVRPSPLAPHDRDMLDAAEVGWARAGLGAAGDCLRGTRVVYHETWDSFRARCHTHRASECLTSYSAGWMGQRSGWQVNIAPGSTTSQRDIRHAALHALVSCQLDRPGWGEGADPGHTDVRVWGDFRAGSAEWHARIAAE